MLRTKHARRSLPAGSQATARPNSDEVATPSWPAYAASGKSKSRATMPINSTKSKMRRSRSLSLKIRNKRSGSHKAPLPVLGGSSDNNSSTSSPTLREKKVGGGGGKERSNPTSSHLYHQTKALRATLSQHPPPPHICMPVDPLVLNAPTPPAVADGTGGRVHTSHFGRKQIGRTRLVFYNDGKEN